MKLQKKILAANLPELRQMKAKDHLLKSKKQLRFSAFIGGLILISLLIPFYFAKAQSGVLIPLPSEKPNPKILSLAVMNVEITIDNQHATVKIMQIFENHQAQILEGKYVFALPKASSISDFAVWDGDQRIPGVMLEKRRANQIYESVKAQKTDPGILQTTDETESAAGFSAKIFPINAFGTKRLEMEYTEDLAVENLTSHFSFPLKPSYGETQTIGEFNLLIRVANDFQFTPIEQANSAYSLQVTKAAPNEFVGEFHASNVELKDDFSFDYQINAAENQLSVVAYRAPEQISVYDLRDPKLANQTADGFFQANAIYAKKSDETRPPKRIVLMLDTSLSMLVITQILLKCEQCLHLQPAT